jgi:2-(1,2-epoxy-1,2-dihydrophenyl)acetyl-CoA isomerase
MTSSVLFDVADGVGFVTLNRPAVLNAIDVDLAEALDRALAEAGARADVRALVIRGAGRGFCAGGDVAKFDGTAPHAVVAARTIDRFHPAVLKLASLPKPTIAAAHGAVAGAGLSMLLACDFAIARADARFTMAYPRIGATIDGGASWFLFRTLGPRRAKQVAMLSDMLDAAEALEFGIVSQVVATQEFDATVKDFARRLAQGPTAAYATIKRLIDGAQSRGLAQQIDEERLGFLAAAVTDDFSEGLSAFLGKRPPSFKGR